jgi:hypothetical protein
LSAVAQRYTKQRATLCRTENSACIAWSDAVYKKGAALYKHKVWRFTKQNSAQYRVNFLRYSYKVYIVIVFY